MILPSQNLIFFDQEILPNSEYALSSSLKPFKSEGGQAVTVVDGRLSLFSPSNPV